MTWDKNRPLGSTPVDTADNLIRENNDYLESAIAQEHGDPASNPSAPEQIVHVQGSGRVIVYTGATELDSSADVVAQVSELYHDTRDIGRCVIDQGSHGNTGRVWYCTATDTFVESPLRFAGNVVFDGTVTATGQINANGHIVIPDTKDIWLPSGQGNVADSLSVKTAIDIFSHASVHALGGQDPLTGIVASNVIFKSSAGPTSSAGTLLTHTYDFSSRSGNSLILALAWLQGYKAFVDAAHSADVEAAIELGDVAQGLGIDLHAGPGSGNAWNDWSSTGLDAAAFLVANASGQKIDLELTAISGTTAGTQARNYGLILVDLGTVGLTTS